MHSCALISGGTVECRGANESGQLGDSTNTDSNVPVTVTGLTSAVSVSTGQHHSCAVIQGGVRCWGSNQTGQLGNGTTVDSNTPVPVAL